MAKRSGSEKRVRVKPRSVRFSPAEEAAIEQMADASGLSFAALVRHALFATPPPRRRPGERDTAKRILGQLGKIGSNVNQLAHYAHLGRYQENSVDMALRDLAEMRIVVLNYFGLEIPGHKTDEPD